MCRSLPIWESMVAQIDHEFISVYCFRKIRGQICTRRNQHGSRRRVARRRTVKINFIRSGARVLVLTVQMRGIPRYFQTRKIFHLAGLLLQVSLRVLNRKLNPHARCLIVELCLASLPRRVQLEFFSNIRVNWRSKDEDTRTFRSRERKRKRDLRQCSCDGTYGTRIESRPTRFSSRRIQ